MLKFFSQAMALIGVIAFFISCTQTTTTNNTTTTATDSVVILTKDAPMMGQQQVGITITTSTKLIPEYMGAGGTTDMFILNNPLDAAFITKIKAGNFNSFVHSEGHFSEWFHWKIPFGTKGSGYNGIKPTNLTEQQWKELLQGGMVATYSRDFNLSFLDLLSATSTKAVYTMNISRGTLSEVYYAIERFPAQATLILMYGQESSSSTYKAVDSKTYPSRFYAWRDSIHAKYPTRKFYDLCDMPEIKAGKQPLWISDFINYKKLSVDIGLRQYSHGFNQYTLDGTIDRDSAAYSGAIKTSLITQMTNINTSFPKSNVFFSQFSTGVPDYAIGQNGNTKKVTGRCLDVMYYMRAEKVWIEASRDSSFNCLGASIIGLKNLLTTLDFKWLGILNTLYTKTRYATTVSHNFGSQVDMLAGYENGNYCIIIQNRSSKEILLPKYWTLDGKKVIPTYSNGNGYSCTSLSATTGTSYNPITENKVPICSIVTFEVKAP